MLSYAYNTHEHCMPFTVDRNKRFWRWIKVQAYKHDGSIHREWSPAFLVEETDRFYALASRASLVTEAGGRRWMTSENAIFFLFKHEWMNVIAMMKEGKGIVYYTNIASPTIYDQGFLRYIDYDLDVKLFPDEAIKELDEKEFRRHSAEYGYDEDTVKICIKQEKKVEEMMKGRAFPFIDGEVKRLYDLFVAYNRPYEGKPKKEDAD